MSVRVLGLDPGFASLGWAVVTLEPGGADKLLMLGVLRTAKSDKKRRVLAADDNFRRARELANELGRLIHAHRIEAICAESMSFPRSSSVAAKIAMAWGGGDAESHARSAGRPGLAEGDKARCGRPGDGQQG